MTFEGFAQQREVMESSKQGGHVDLENDFLWKQLIHYWQNRNTTLQNRILSVFTAAGESKNQPSTHSIKCGTDLHQEKDVIVQAELNLL